MTSKTATFVIVLAAVMLAAGAYYGGREHMKTGAAANGETAPLGAASFAFAITDIERDGNIVSFTIPKNARALEDKADAVVLSGLYASGTQKSDECPVVHSDDVDDSVEDYSPMSGRARVTANFEDEDKAKAALESGCLLINDPT